MRQTIGIDVSKDTLDAYRLSDGEHIQVGNDKLGHRTLIRWLGKDRGPLVVFEATGAYHRQMETALAARTIPFVEVNPRQARRFAEATGRLAKTDRVDAVMLAKMGGAWDDEELNRFIADPMRVLPGTDMEAHGYQKLEDRADLIAFRQTLSDSPVPLPGN